MVVVVLVKASVSVVGEMLAMFTCQNIHVHSRKKGRYNLLSLLPLFKRDIYQELGLCYLG